ncbi:ABC transporter permease [Sphingomonas sp. RHCKR7]|uniref:ABC transporter permease n=1 Tax=Sphingomonas folli TaxID=2862497 RepID=UPI001C67D8ED|nr:ABC transporter permease [Sphingomonas folli]MBW6528335.1 ABC transporter permease [Sphingomonas folli]
MSTYPIRALAEAGPARAAVWPYVGTALDLPLAAAEPPDQVQAAAPTGFAARRRVPLGVALAALFLALLLVAALAPGLVIGGDPLVGSGRDAFYAPSAAHWLGTDENGRDVLVRLVHGVHPSLLMGFAATALALVAGTALGLVAGLGGRVADALVGRLLDTLLAFPDLLLALVIITFFGQGLGNAIVAVGVAATPRYARMVRSQAKLVRASGYVEAARTLGQPGAVLIWRHVLPNAVRPVLLVAAMGVGVSIGAGAALSFLGFGAPPPAPEWGAMLAVGRNFLANAWWLVAAPGAAITLTVLAVTALGRAAIRHGEGREL